MPEPIRRPSLVEQKKLDKTYGQRMDVISKREPSVVESGPKKIEEDEIGLKSISDYLEDVESIQESADLTDLDNRGIAIKKYLESLNKSKIDDYPSFSGAIYEMIDIIDQTLGPEYNTPPEISSRLAALKEWLLKSLE